MTLVKMFVFQIRPADTKISNPLSVDLKGGRDRLEVNKVESRPTFAAELGKALSFQ